MRAAGLELLRGGSRFEIDGTAVELSVPGRHNVLNALAALTACRRAGVENVEAAAALASYSGAGRRFEEHGVSAGGALVFDDYAHHPPRCVRRWRRRGRSSRGACSPAFSPTSTRER